MNKIKKKVKTAAGTAVRLFVLPLLLQIAVVHLAIGVLLSKSLIGRPLLISESAMIALSIVICQIFQTYVFQVRRPARREHQTVRLLKSEAVR